MVNTTFTQCAEENSVHVHFPRDPDTEGVMFVHISKKFDCL